MWFKIPLILKAQRFLEMSNSHLFKKYDNIHNHKYLSVMDLILFEKYLFQNYCI